MYIFVCVTFIIKQDHMVNFKKVISMCETLIVKQDQMVNFKKFISMCETLMRPNNGIGHQVALSDSNTDNQEISNNIQKVCNK